MFRSKNAASLLVFIALAACSGSSSGTSSSTSGTGGVGTTGTGSGTSSSGGTTGSMGGTISCSGPVAGSSSAVTGEIENGNDLDLTGNFSLTTGFNIAVQFGSSAPQMGTTYSLSNVSAVTFSDLTMTNTSVMCTALTLTFSSPATGYTHGSITATFTMSNNGTETVSGTF